MKRTPLRRRTPLARTRTPTGLCQCGCGQKTSIAPQTWNAKGIKKGDPMRYVKGHGPRGKPGAWVICAAADCENKFWRWPSQAQKRKHCSKACHYANMPRLTEAQKAAHAETMRAALRETRQGAGNPNYRHGRKAGVHIRGWNAAAKGELLCRVCAARAQDLHHAIPRSVCPPEAKRDLRNGLPLCKPCHQKWHRKTLVITRDVFTADEWDYLSSLELAGRVTAAWLDKHYPEPEEVAA